MNSSHQSVKLLLDQDLLPSSPFSWPCWGHGADTRNPTYVPPTIPRAAGTSMRRVKAAEWLGRAVIHHLTIFFVGSGEPVRRRESEGKFYLRQSVAFEPDIIRFDRPSVVLGTNAETKHYWATQGPLPSPRRTTRSRRRQGLRRPCRASPPASPSRPQSTRRGGWATCRRHLPVLDRVRFCVAGCAHR